MTARLRVRVHPGARHERVGKRMADGTWRLEVQAAPEAGAANEAVVKLLAHALGLRRDAVRVTAGRASRGKTIEIEGLEVADVEARLERAAMEEA